MEFQKNNIYVYFMFNAETATLVLRSADLTANTTNAIGTADVYLLRLTWNNINLRTLLGSMYEKYDRFCLVPTQIQSVVASGSIGSTADDRNCLVFISGLPFTNNTYNVSTLTNTNVAFLNFVRFVAAQPLVSSSMGNNIMFTKNQELVNLTIFYQRINKNGAGNYDVVTTTAYPNMLFSFNIYGVDKTDRVFDTNGSRMF
jgi:hypothetical protein